MSDVQDTIAVNDERLRLVLSSVSQLLDDLLEKKMWKESDIESLRNTLTGHRRSVDIQERVSKLDTESQDALASLLGEARYVIKKKVFPTGMTPKTHLPLRIRGVLLRSCQEWSFDCEQLVRPTSGRSLSTLLMFYIEQVELIDALRLNVSKLQRFARRLEENYGDNMYHNSVHATSVLQTVYVMLFEGGIYDRLLRENNFENYLTLLACLMAAACHDYRHRGVTNAFLEKSHDRLAITYNDTSVNENWHLASTFLLLENPDCNFLEGLEDEEMLTFRKIMITMVLHTDMQKHLETIQDFKTHMTTNSPLASRNISTLKMMIKCADLSHLTYEWELHIKWVKRLEEEMFAQGDMEKAKGLTVSPLMDRNKAGVSSSQVGFYEYIILPMYKTIVEAFPLCRPMLLGADKNMARWKASNAAEI